MIIPALCLAASLIGAGFVFFRDFSNGTPERRVVFETDGSKETIFTETATVKEFLETKNITVKSHDYLEPPESTPIRPGLLISYNKAKRVYLAHAGMPAEEIMSAGDTVCDLLIQEGISIGPLDRIVPHPSTPLAGDMFVEVSHVEVVDVTMSHEIDPPLVIEADPELPRGRMEEVSEGSPGIAEDITRYYYLNGEETARIELGSRVVSEPVERVARVGVRSAPALASRGGSGIHRDVLEMNATGYDPGPGSCWPFADGFTATGHIAGHGVCAVDPSVIPLGTELWVEGYGYALACDTGGAIKGNRIDMCFDTRAEAMRWGRRNVLVYVLE